MEPVAERRTSPGVDGAARNTICSDQHSLSGNNETSTSSPSFCSQAQAFAQSVKWSEEKANEWYARQPWLVGSQLHPGYRGQSARDVAERRPSISTASNLELIWAENLGMNTMRVFLHDLVWKQDPNGFKKRIDQFLSSRQEAPHQADFRPVRFLLGPVPRDVPPAAAAARHPQFPLGAESRRGGYDRSEAGERASSTTCPTWSWRSRMTTAFWRGTSGTSPTT